MQFLSAKGKLKNLFRIGLAVIVILSVSFALFAAVAIVYYGVPPWYIFRHFLPGSGLNIAGSGIMVVSIVPSSPTDLNQKEVLTVLNSNQTPIANVSVAVSYGDSIFNTFTNNSGIALFAFAGSPTIVETQKMGYTSVMEVVPTAPETWIRQEDYSILTGIVPGIVSGLAVYFVTSKLDNRKKATTKKKSRKKSS